MKNQKGLSLIEVAIAMTLFATFITAFMASQGQNFADSAGMKEEEVLKNLAQRVMTDLELNPPEYSESLTNTKESKNFDDYPNYKYEIEFAKMVLPDLEKIQGKDPAAQEGGGSSSPQQLLFKTFTENLQRIIWQTRITITNTESGKLFILSGWLYNVEAKAEVNGV